MPSPRPREPFGDATGSSAGLQTREPHLAYSLRAALRPDDFLDRADDFFGGTLPPARLASESPIAIACFRLVTFLPERPLLSVPRFRSCIAFSTFCAAFSPYFAIGTSLTTGRCNHAAKLGASLRRRPTRAVGAPFARK